LSLFPQAACFDHRSLALRPPQNWTTNLTADGGTCTEVEAGVFRRPWSKLDIELDCNTWSASFTKHEERRAK
jgi:hypothetical protein